MALVDFATLKNYICKYKKSKKEKEKKKKKNKLSFLIEACLYLNFMSTDKPAHQKDHNTDNIWRRTLWHC